MQIKENLKKATSWTAEHSVELMYGAVIAGTIAVTVWAAKAQYKADVAYAEELKKTYDELGAAVARGASVLPGPNGYWIIEKNAV